MSPSALRRQIGQLLVAGFDGLQVPVELRALAREFGLGGVILFGRNIDHAEQIAELCYEVGRLVPDLPVWVSVDQEGGRVARLKEPFTRWPPMATLGRSGDAGLAERFARALGSELKAVGISLDYAPVLDINTNPKNPVIGDRALGEKAGEVARLGSAIIQALQRQGVAACGKHFPGHGDTSSDSHVELPLVEHPPERLREVEFVPFRAAIEAKVATIMTAHILVPALDEEHPATLSRRIITGVLREELGYDGVILSDDLDMKAIAARHSIQEAAVMAVAAGCDGVLVCHSGQHIAAGRGRALAESQAVMLEQLIHAVEEERLPRGRVEAALARLQRAKLRFLGAGTASRPSSARDLRQALGRDEHQAIAEEMARFA